MARGRETDLLRNGTVAHWLVVAGCITLILEKTVQEKDMLIPSRIQMNVSIRVDRARSSF